MHGREWHDHNAPKALEPERMAGADAVPDVEGGGVKMGLGRFRAGTAAGSKGRVRRKRTTPVGKGVAAKKRGGAKKISQGGHRAKQRA
jgi:hypothetical protein